MKIDKIIRTVGLVVVFFAALPAFATHTDPIFNTDISSDMVTANGQPDGTTQTFSSDCTADPGCNEFFDIGLTSGSTLSLTFCSDGGTADFDTGLGIWNTTDLSTLLVGNDDFCSLQSELDFVAPEDGIFRVRVGGFGSAAGTYTLAYAAPGGSIINGAAIDDHGTHSVARAVPVTPLWSLAILALSLVFVTRRKSRRL